MPPPSINISEDNLTAYEIAMQQRRFNAQAAHQS
jgi:DNA replication licensing factor MCM7